jgi:HK97 family phage portal protein
MPIVQTPYGPKPTLSLARGSATDLAMPSTSLMAAASTGIGLTAGRTISFSQLYRTQPWVGAAARRLSEQAARIPLHGFRYTDPEREHRERDRDHAVVRLLEKPRDGRLGVNLRWTIALGLKVHGQTLLWKRRPRRGAPPAELWQLDWRFVVPILDGSHVIAWQWRGRGVPGLDYGTQLDPTDVVHIAWDAPEGEIGVSPLEQLGVTLRSEDAIQRYSEAGFRNGTRLGVAAILDKSVSADKVMRDGVREELTGVHGGVDQAFKPAILGGGIVDVKTLGGQTAAEAALIEQRNVNREEVAAVYGIPQPLAGILDHATYSNIGELLGALFTIYLAPDFALTAGALQAQLVDAEPAWSDDGLFVAHNLDEVLRGDTVERMKAYATALDHGVLTLNDVRRRENEKPYDDPRADEPLIAANNVRPLSAIGSGDDETDPAKKVGQTILDVIGQHATRALDRAARGVGAGKSSREALDRDRLVRELRADRTAAGANGSTDVLVDGLADAIAHEVEPCQTIDDVRAVAARYALN